LKGGSRAKLGGGGLLSRNSPPSFCVPPAAKTFLERKVLDSKELNNCQIKNPFQKPYFKVLEEGCGEELLSRSSSPPFFIS
jgi:hypothetical protein